MVFRVHFRSCSLFLFFWLASVLWGCSFFHVCHRRWLYVPKPSMYDTSIQREPVMTLFRFYFCVACSLPSLPSSVNSMQSSLVH